MLGDLIGWLRMIVFGIPTEATVINFRAEAYTETGRITLSSSSGKRYYAIYRFTGPNDSPFFGETQIGERQLDQLRELPYLNVRYLPRNPKKSKVVRKGVAEIIRYVAEIILVFVLAGAWLFVLFVVVMFTLQYTQ